MTADTPDMCAGICKALSPTLTLVRIIQCAITLHTNMCAEACIPATNGGLLTCVHERMYDACLV